MGKNRREKKITDYETRFRVAGGIGIVREEVWVNPEGRITRYNLALILPHLFAPDRGRVLGFDNAHGAHERHFMATVETVDFIDYLTTSQRFFREAEQIRRTYENADF